MTTNAEYWHRLAVRDAFESACGSHVKLVEVKDVEPRPEFQFKVDGLEATISIGCNLIRGDMIKTAKRAGEMACSYARSKTGRVDQLMAASLAAINEYKNNVANR